MDTCKQDAPRYSDFTFRGFLLFQPQEALIGLYSYQMFLIIMDYL